MPASNGKGNDFVRGNEQSFFEQTRPQVFEPIFHQNPSRPPQCYAHQEKGLKKASFRENCTLNIYQNLICSGVAWGG